MFGVVSTSSQSAGCAVGARQSIVNRMSASKTWMTGASFFFDQRFSNCVFPVNDRLAITSDVNEMCMDELDMFRSPENGFSDGSFRKYPTISSSDLTFASVRLNVANASEEHDDQLMPGVANCGEMCLRNGSGASSNPFPARTSTCKTGDSIAQTRIRKKQFHDEDESEEETESEIKSVFDRLPNLREIDSDAKQKEEASHGKKWWRSWRPSVKSAAAAERRDGEGEEDTGKAPRRQCRARSLTNR
eukprot:TRINITY_DN22170_c0_g1_i3.p1 TRINITY_DN22170_c0_g1~~TRINITY_DN22170_c0_g1_i3.p1  ORF type:complete len:271 (-),score=35.23 TRINITY_DN22170_c0_g1_i3:20-757(-)